MLAVLLATAPFLPFSVAVADGSADQKKVVEQLAAELNRLNDRIAALADQYGALQGEKAALDRPSPQCCSASGCSTINRRIIRRA